MTKQLGVVVAVVTVVQLGSAGAGKGAGKKPGKRPVAPR